MKPSMARKRIGVVEVEDELPIGSFTLPLFVQMVFAIRRKFRHLPCLMFVFPEILDDEGLDFRDAQQTLTGGVNGEAAQITSNPSAVQLFGHSSSCSAPNKAVEDEVIFV